MKKLLPALLLLALVGCGAEMPQEDGAMPAPGPDSLLRQPLGPLPELLSQTGLFPLAPDLSAPAQAVVYAPRYPLWTNGSDKLRHLVLPQGATLDTSDPEQWAYPPGTLLFKTFSYRDALGQPRHIETRLLRRSQEGWDYGVYQWNQGSTDATLLDLRQPVEVTLENGDQGTLTHEIPSKIQCRKCHESANSDSEDSFVLGLSAMQASPLEPGLPSSLDQLTELGLLSEPVEPAAPVYHEDPDTQAVMAYMVGNCVHCHNGGVGGSRSFDLRPAVFLENTLNEPTDSSAFAVGTRVVPGDPAQSLLYQAVRGDSSVEGVKDMPPAGVQLRDAQAIELLERWILALPTEP